MGSGRRPTVAELDELGDRQRVGNKPLLLVEIGLVFGAHFHESILIFAEIHCAGESCPALSSLAPSFTATSAMNMMMKIGANRRLVRKTNICLHDEARHRRDAGAREARGGCENASAPGRSDQVGIK